MKQTALVDAGPLIAIFGERDQDHERCVEALRVLRLPLLTCWPVLAEVAYLLQSRFGEEAVHKLLRSVDGQFLRILPLDESDVPAIDAIIAKYADNRLQLADAALMHLAHRERVSAVFTIDHKDFSVYQLPSGKHLTLLP